MSNVVERGDQKTPILAGALGLLRLVINGDCLDVTGSTLADVLDGQGYGDRKVATAVNGRFVAAADRAATVLRDGDQVEIVAPRQGG